ncbi:predicted protein [Plenodomus lingam JN3]|uniref:Predicted protein n=1 Tax=Leptosphaeria maculans (strain JN3 / isolate v23.1.3 / race Av1-4-5-6-7-8) TaxID=985895 RepID=E5A5E5_LEPMJ|nr:predicted protein [Plenodomus lingam JN3]CBX98843.1 predicted protein [Plenodomus lingam JN3]
MRSCMNCEKQNTIHKTVKSLPSVRVYGLELGVSWVYSRRVGVEWGVAEVYYSMLF